jgi:hypothetical protein
MPGSDNKDDCDSESHLTVATDPSIICWLCCLFLFNRLLCSCGSAAKACADIPGRNGCS